MKFPGFKEFISRMPTIEEVYTFLRSDLNANFRELSLGLKKLDFSNNFESFEVTISISAGAQLPIENKLRDAVPSRRIIVRSNSFEITDGDTAWSKQYVYLKNNGASTATVTVIFLK